MDTTDQPSSICHIQPIQMYTLRPSETKNPLPFTLLSGEMIINSGTSVDGLIVITNYRLYLQITTNQHHIPLGLIEIVEHRDLFFLQIGCKDARTYRCTFENNESCLEWYDRIVKSAEPPKQLEQLFGFYHFVWSKEKDSDSVICAEKYDPFDKKMFEDEMTRLQFEGDSWRISKVNENYKLCPSYPPYLLVPSCINDEILESVAKFRSSRRIPAAVWRHRKNGAVIARCSQPEVGWLGWRSSEDEDLVKAMSEACNFDRNRIGSDKDSNLSHSPGSLHSDESLQITGPMGAQGKKVLIMDARSYTTAVANRARGGGCECPEYYPNCEIQFMNLANIHSIRKSFHALRQLCAWSADQPNWFSQLEGTRWLLHMSGLMKAALTLVTAVELDARPVLVHCSDGWDRTPQIVALAQLLLDPFYRTIEGFRILIEREWLAFGHKFADRCGHSTGSEDQNERCPVFLQWLDCVHQLLIQFPCAFQFSQTYLVKLAQHTYSNLFGTFLCNTQQERSKSVYGKTFSAWEFLNGSNFRNHLYAPPLGNSYGTQVLWPQCNVRHLQLWSEMYLGTMEANFSLDGFGSCSGPPEITSHHMTKTRSFGDLMNAGGEACCPSMLRRSSDPNINNSDKKLNDLSNETNSETNDGVAPADLEAMGCNSDCLYKNTNNETLTDDQIDGLDLQEGGENVEAAVDTVNCLKHVINVDKTDNVEENHCEFDGVVRNCENSDDINHNSGLNGGQSGGAALSRTHVCDVQEKSVDTSTETLVGEQVVCSSSPKEVNGFEKIQSPCEEDNLDACRMCTISQNNQKSVQGSSSLSSGQTSVNSTPPYHSRTSSSNGWDSSLHNLPTIKPPYSYQYPLGDDGLIPLRSVVQERLDQIIEEQRKKEEILQKELQVLSKQSSVVESVGSVGEGPVDSLCSDMSWEALEASEPPSARWVPDHAVNRCVRCKKEFWFAKRKHHCRKCGNIFCADCSKNSTPLPSEQLFQPVRVCSWCYSELRKDCGELPNQCKQDNTQTTNNNPQITASSN